MIDFLLWVTMTAYWVAFILGMFVIIAIRLVSARVTRLPFFRFLFVVFTPFSIGYYVQFPTDRPFRRIHRIVSIIVLVCTILASVWILYTRYA